MMNKLLQKMKSWLSNDEGAAAAEFVLVFPLMFTMILGIWDVGNCLAAGKRAIAASQVVADLIGRELTVDMGEVNQAVLAGEIAMEPFDATGYSVEILSVGFDEDGKIITDSSEFWEYSTDGVSVGYDLYESVQNLSVPSDGLIAVRVTYDYKPVFGEAIIGDIQIEEVSFIRGRKVENVKAEWKQ